MRLSWSEQKASKDRARKAWAKKIEADESIGYDMSNGLLSVSIDKENGIVGMTLWSAPS
jgi:hypothetical protein